MNYSVYELDTGMVTRTGWVSPDLVHMVPAAGEGVLPGLELNPDMQYVDLETKAPKPRSKSKIQVNKTVIEAGGFDVATFAPIPQGAQVFVNAEMIEVNDGRLEVGAEDPGSIDVLIIAFPDRDFHAVLDVRLPAEPPAPRRGIEVQAGADPT